MHITVPINIICPLADSDPIAGTAIDVHGCWKAYTNFHPSQSPEPAARKLKTEHHQSKAHKLFLCFCRMDGRCCSSLLAQRQRRRGLEPVGPKLAGISTGASSRFASRIIRTQYYVKQDNQTSYISQETSFPKAMRTQR